MVATFSLGFGDNALNAYSVRCHRKSSERNHKTGGSMDNNDNFDKLVRPFELLDRNIISASCHMHIYKRINAISHQIKIDGKDADAITAVRAGSITSALVSLMACLDKHHSNYSDRASIGGLIHRLNTPDYRDYFSQYHGEYLAYDQAVQALEKAFTTCHSSNAFFAAKKLRDNEVAHILVLDDTPTVTYECLDSVFLDVQNMCDLAFAALGCGGPANKSYEANHEATADWFIKTYVKGMQS
jgi:hypothetical protein